MATVGTSNSDRTVNLRLQCVVKKHDIHRIILTKTGHDPHSSTLVVICVVLCIVCV